MRNPRPHMTPINGINGVHGDQEHGTREAHDMKESQHGLTASLQTTRPAEELLSRCQALLVDIEAFREQLKQRRREHTVELGHYRGLVKAELKNLERLDRRQKEAQERRIAERAAASNDERLADWKLEDQMQELCIDHSKHDTTRGTGTLNGEAIQVNGQQDSPAAGSIGDQDMGSVDKEEEGESECLPAQQSVASSNLPFLESVWNAAKHSSDLVGLQKRFYYGEDMVRKGLATRGRSGHYRSATVKSGKALVDIVADKGEEWIKVSLVTTHRILMDKAREGWGGDSSDDEEDSDSDLTNDSDDPDSGIPIVKMASSIMNAAKEVRIHTKHPRVRLLLPRISEGTQPDIDKILQRLRKGGICVECGGASVSPQPLGEILDRMISDPFVNFTSTLNIDCTILLAMVSDFSHSHVESEPWFHNALKKQVEIEDKESLLPNLLYPAIVGRRLLCTNEAAKRMREIVGTIGTPKEKERTEIFMPHPDEQTHSPEEAHRRRELLRRLTKFDVPEELSLPIQIVEKDSVSYEHLPSVAAKVKESLSAINQSVFLYGWATGTTVVTSNRTVVKQMDSILDRHAESETDWPNVWLCPTARSLVGKEKGRRE